MPIKAFIYIMLAFWCLPFWAGAGVVKGKVTGQNGESLPYATIYIDGTTSGVNTGANGEFAVTLEPGLYKLICRYVGYDQSAFNVSITGNEVITHNFELHSQSLEMKEVVVNASDEDPAYEIIRNAIRRRKFHLDQVQSFHSSIYLKGIMRSRKLPDKFMGEKIDKQDAGTDSAGKGILYLTEEDADYYTDGKTEHTIIHSVHESGDPQGLGMSRFPSVISFYENNVQIFPNSRGFISPIAELALNYYKYKLLGQFTENGTTIYKIKVTQKRSFEPCFDGTIYIADSEFAIHSLNMTLAKKSGMDIIDTVRLEQVYIPQQHDLWTIKSQVLYMTVNLFGFDVIGNFVTVYNHQRVNEPIPDSLVKSRVISEYDRTANKKDSTYWQKNRPLGLAAEEQMDFFKKDSVYRYLDSPKAKAHRDSMRIKGNKNKPLSLLMGGYHWNGPEYKDRINTNSTFLGFSGDNIINYNIVEGFNLAPKVYWQHFVDTGKYLHTEAAVRYGFSNTHFDAIGRMYYTVNDRKWRSRSWLYGADVGRYVFQYDPENPVIPIMNTASALFLRQNDLKLYERNELTGYVKRNYGNGLKWEARLSYQQRFPLDTTTNYSFVARPTNGFNDNLPAHLQQVTVWQQNDAALAHFAVSYKPGYTYTQYPDYKVPNGSHYPQMTLEYDKGISGIFNSESNFDKWRFAIRDHKNLRLWGNFYYNLAVGGFLNNNYVSVPDLMHLYGNRGIGFASPYMTSYQFAQYYDFSNKDRFYEEIHLEHHLNGLLSNKIPLLRQASWYILAGTNMFYSGPANYYYEAFVGLDNIGWKLFRFLRIDYVYSWSSYRGINEGVRVGINSRFFSVSSGREEVGEW